MKKISTSIELQIMLKMEALQPLVFNFYSDLFTEEGKRVFNEQTEKLSLELLYLLPPVYHHGSYRDSLLLNKFELLILAQEHIKDISETKLSQLTSNSKYFQKKKYFN